MLHKESYERVWTNERFRKDMWIICMNAKRNNYHGLSLDEWLAQVEIPRDEYDKLMEDYGGSAD
jgi:hypothetical protein